MKLAFYSIVLNHHQACVADELYAILGNDYVFVELVNLNDNKGGDIDYTQKPYLIRAWHSREESDKAMAIACEADVCVFGGHPSIKYEKERMKLGLLSFEMGERWLKRGWINIFSPRLLEYQWYYHTSWYKKPLYRLCSSAFVAEDLYKLHSFKNRCYKWGYFTKVEKFAVEASLDVSMPENATILWCARFLKWKHPELVVALAKKLKTMGYRVHIDMYGSGPLFCEIEKLIKKENVGDIIALKGTVSNTEVLSAMRQHGIFIFTSDRNEGWGAVLNEAMSSCCAVVASDKIGSVPYLIKDGFNGLSFESENINSLYNKVVGLLGDPAKRIKMAEQAYYDMCNIWSPQVAANNLLQLIDCLHKGQETSIKHGPCSKA